jgi:hypothetical protein
MGFSPPPGLAVLLLARWCRPSTRAETRHRSLGGGGDRRARRTARLEDRLLLDTADFGFYAVIAGFTRPERAEPVDDRDPRRPPGPDVFGSEASLRERMAKAGARLLVVRAEHAPLASRFGSIEHRGPRHLLVALP